MISASLALRKPRPGVKKEIANVIEQTCKEEFGEELPPVKNLIDAKAIQDNEKIKHEQELVKEVTQLRSQIIEQKQLLGDEEEFKNDVKTYDVVLRVKPEKADQIKSQIIGDQKYLIIPMEENEHVNVNGVNTQV